MKNEQDLKYMVTITWYVTEFKFEFIILYETIDN